MISVIVQLLIAFPKIGAMFLKVRTAYVKELATRRYNKHNADIQQWVRDPKAEQDTRVHTGTEQPRV
jgi:hypothetical protein